MSTFLAARKAFTLIEILIIVSIFGILSVVVLSAINPLEQINRGRDAALVSMGTEVISAINRWYAISRGASVPWELIGDRLNDESSQTMLEYLIDINELKSSFPSRSELANLHITSGETIETAVCFQPHSELYRSRPETAYDQTATLWEECGNECYYCLGLSGGQVAARPAPDSQTVAMAGSESPPEPEASSVPSPSPSPSPSPAPTLPPFYYGPLCFNFDSERPKFPLTSNRTVYNTEHGCTHYFILNGGCSHRYCSPGQRLLVKEYYGSIECGQKSEQIRELYCVDEPEANCTKPMGFVDTSYFDWGCGNPVRPYKWKDEYL